MNAATRDEGLNERYLKELEQVLQAEAELARQGSDLLADPEYRALRELFVDGDLSLVEFLGRVEALADARPDDDEDEEDEDGTSKKSDDADEEDEGGEGDEGGEDDWDDLDDDGPEPLRVS